MKKFLMIFIAIFAIFVQSSAQVLLKPDKYIWEYTGLASDTIGVGTKVWQKSVQLNKIDGVYYNAKIKVSDVVAGATATIIRESKIFEDDVWTPIDSVLWTGVGSTDTTIVFTSNTNKTYDRYLNFKVRRTEGKAKIEKVQLSIKK
jgi:hypothetical protein